MDTDAFNTIVAQNVQLTMMAGTLTAVASQPTAEPATQEAAVIPTATLTEAPAATATVLNGVWVSFNANTNCRFGPGTAYYLIKTFETGDQAEVVGQSTDGTYIYVKSVDASTHYCWVPTSYATLITGTLNQIAKITPYPTNTPTVTPTGDASFSLSFNGISNCGGNYYVRVQVANTGYLTWKSIKIKVVDNDTGDKMVEESDSFVEYSDCAMDVTQADLTTGEPGIVTNYNFPFAYDLENESLTITVTLYSKDGLAGTSVSRSITVTP